MRTERDFESLLELLLEGHTTAEDEGLSLSTRTFEDAGLLTRNRGLVVTVTDEQGRESTFQLTVVRGS
jgi:hypothetical protein